MTGIGREGSFLGRREDTGPAAGDCTSGIAGGRRRSLRKARAYLTQDRVMERAHIADTEHFKVIAQYLEQRGWVAEADADYGVFVLSASGIEEATR